MKYEALLKRMTVEAVLIAGVLFMGMGVAYYVDTIRDDYESQTSVLKREVEVLQQETGLLRQKFSKVQSNAAIYQEAMEKQEKGELNITRQIARSKFNRFNDEYFLGNLRLTMSAIEEAEGEKYISDSGFITESEVAVNFEAVSDEYVYAMLNAMTKEMAGTVRITNISLLRQRTLSDDILQVISQKGVFPLVVGEIKFKWYGLKLTDNKNADGK